MADLQSHKVQADPKLNIYFQNRRIRNYLIKAGLINHKGDILPQSSSEPVLPRRAKQQQQQLPKSKLSKSVHNYIIEEQEKHEKFIPNGPKSVTKSIVVETNIESRSTPQTTAFNATDGHQSLSPTKKKKLPSSAKSPRRYPRLSKKNGSPSSTRKQESDQNVGLVEMIYYGPPLCIEYKANWFQPNGDEILVSQQHCGGENLTVFKGYVKPYGTFTFNSRRHPDYPFALTFYINGLINSRISTCCEYRHKRNVPLGGRQGLFGIIKVKNLKPCRKCDTHLNKRIDAHSYCRYSCKYKKVIKTSRSTTFVQPESSRYRTSFTSRFIPRNQSSPPDQKKQLNLQETKSIRSPHISRTPTPSSSEGSKSQTRKVMNRALSAAPIRNKQPSESTDKDPYASDFEPNQDDDTQTSNQRYGRPRISDSYSIDSQEENNKSPRQSPTVFKSLTQTKRSVKTTDNNNADINSRRSPTSTSEKLDQTFGQANVYATNVLGKKDSNDDNSFDDSSSSSFPKESDSIDAGDSSDRSEVLLRENGLPSASSRKLPSDTTTNDKQFFTDDQSQNRIGMRQTSLDSEESERTKSLSKKSHNLPSSSNADNALTEEDFLGIRKAASSKQQVTSSDLCDEWFTSTNDTNKRDKKNNDFASNFKPASWQRQIDSDEDD